MLTTRRALAALAAAALSIVLLGCQNTAPSPSPGSSTSPPARPSSSAGPSPSDVAAGTLVTVETRGGECPQGACGGTIAIDADGRVHALEPAEIEVGTVPEVVLDGLKIELEDADFAALAAVPFTGECPVNVDGQEIIYTFTTASGEVRLASCEVVIDESNPLFVAIQAALAAAGA